MPAVDRPETHALAASLYTLLSGLQMLMSAEASDEPTRADVHRAVVGSFDDFSQLRTAFDPAAELKTRRADGGTTSFPIAAIIDLALSIRPRFEKWNGSWPVPEDCARAATKLLELSGWPSFGR
jgi:hypothetical protein